MVSGFSPGDIEMREMHSLFQMLRQLRQIMRAGIGLQFGKRFNQPVMRHKRALLSAQDEPARVAEH